MGKSAVNQTIPVGRKGLDSGWVCCSQGLSWFRGSEFLAQLKEYIFQIHSLYCLHGNHVGRKLDWKAFPERFY